MATALFTFFACLVYALDGRPVLPVPEFHINLDVAPEERFKEVIQHFEATLYDFYAKNVKDSAILKDIIDQIVAHRGEEVPELAAEIRGIAKYSKIPINFIKVAQLLYELQTVMIPFENITWPWGQTTQLLGGDFKVGCTGVIARSADDGTVTHARNMDFSFAKWMANMTYNAIFSKGGQELYTAHMIAGYSAIATGIRRGKNGYTFEVNTRYPPKEWNIDSLWKHLFEEKRTTSGWLAPDACTGTR